MEQLKIQKEFWDYIVSGDKIAEIRKIKHAHLAGQWVEMVCVDTGKAFGKVYFGKHFTAFTNIIDQEYEMIATLSLNGPYSGNNQFTFIKWLKLREYTANFLREYNTDGTLILLSILKKEVY